MTLSPEQRKLRGQIAAHEMHARNDPRAITAGARAGRMAKFRRRVEEQMPGLDEAEVDRRVRHLMQAEMKRLALLSSKARAARKRAAP